MTNGCRLVGCVGTSSFIFNRAEDNGILTILKSNADIHASILNVSSTGKATLKLDVYDEKNNLVNFRNTTVSIKVNGKTVLGKINITNGTAEVSLDLLPNAKPYTITVVSGENSFYLGATTTITYANTLPKVATNASVETQANGNGTQVTVNVKDADGNLVKANPKIAIKVDGKTVATDLKAVNGTLTTTIATPTAGMHKLLVIAGETASYASSRYETSITF